MVYCKYEGGRGSYISLGPCPVPGTEWFSIFVEGMNIPIYTNTCIASLWKTCKNIETAPASRKGYWVVRGGRMIYFIAHSLVTFEFLNQFADYLLEFFF